eukprot:TRINITY_DN7148_c0_g1_i10.p1 TRINITY_DN7148_c0_g1~~TRINITY_DN7148_c0_g1_i10.p1  ORF type:complete len:128 (+),score=15.75 TRINITY_DN7148_c0_g1_i10:110-493(+)
MSTLLNGVLELRNGKLQTGQLVRMKNRRGISQHFSSTHTSTMTNRSKIEIMDCLQYVAGGEKLLVDNSFHFYIMVEPFLCNVQVIASYLSTILMLPPYPAEKPTATNQKSFSWTQKSVNRYNYPKVI